MAKIRILIATPSFIDQSRLQKSLHNNERFEVVGCVGDLSATYCMVEELIPAAVLIAESFTSAEEYSCMKSLFHAVETKTIVVRPVQTRLTEGVEKKVGEAAITSRMSGAEIAKVIENVSFKPLFNDRTVFAAPANGAALQCYTKKIVLIGASTGGIDALTTILPYFPKDCPPTAIVQHTGQNFSATLARLLDRHCHADVVLANSGLEMQSGRICLAGGIDGHLHLRKSGQVLRCHVQNGPATSGHAPSIDELFYSAVPFARDVIAILLTGMGRDGAAGLLALRQAGAATIGQDQTTSIVYGMPRIAYEIGAVQQQLALEGIGPSLSKIWTGQARVLNGVVA